MLFWPQPHWPTVLSWVGFSQGRQEVVMVFHKKGCPYGTEKRLVLLHGAVLNHHVLTRQQKHHVLQWMAIRQMSSTNILTLKNDDVYDRKKESRGNISFADPMLLVEGNLNRNVVTGPHTIDVSKRHGYPWWRLFVALLRRREEEPCASEQQHG